MASLAGRLNEGVPVREFGGHRSALKESLISI